MFDDIDGSVDFSFSPMVGWYWLCGIRDVASKGETHVAFDVVHLMRDPGILKAAPSSSLRTSGAMSPPSDVCWFTNPMNSIVLYTVSIITHSYWSYVHQLSYHKSPINHKSHEIPVFVGKCSACSNCSHNKPLPRCRGTYEDIHHSWWISSWLVPRFWPFPRLIEGHVPSIWDSVSNPKELWCNQVKYSIFFWMAHIARTCPEKIWKL